jgi:hypothetical protein
VDSACWCLVFRSAVAHFDGPCSAQLQQEPDVIDWTRAGKAAPETDLPAGSFHTLVCFPPPYSVDIGVDVLVFSSLVLLSLEISPYLPLVLHCSV